VLCSGGTGAVDWTGAEVDVEIRSFATRQVDIVVTCSLVAC
jgi:hypothetical protein